VKAAKIVRSFIIAFPAARERLVVRHVVVAFMLKVSMALGNVMWASSHDIDWRSRQSMPWCGRSGMPFIEAVK
jgi:hypothetical protein